MAAAAAGVTLLAATGCSGDSGAVSASPTPSPSVAEVTARVVGKPETEYGSTRVIVELRNDTESVTAVCALVAAVKGDIQVEQIRKCIPGVAPGQGARTPYGFDAVTSGGAAFEIVETHTEEL